MVPMISELAALVALANCVCSAKRTLPDGKLTPHTGTQNKNALSKEKAFSIGADDRSRTDTVSLPLDFESSASANFTTSANA